MEKIGVLGLGNWGTALANHLARKGHEVLGWSIESEVVEGINSEHKNHNYLSHVELHELLHATGDLEAVASLDVVVLVVPSHAVADVVSKLKPRPGQLLVSAVKGIVAESLQTPRQCIDANLGGSFDTAVLSGPSFAKDIVVGRPCGIVAASCKKQVAQRTAELFSSDTMRVYMSLDPLGVEIGAAVKNVIALAAGVCDGMELGDSARAGLITRGLAEMMRLAEGMGGDRRTLAGLSGLGDLIMTATCDSSRNRTVGLRLGRGESLSHILETLGSVAEGVSTTPLVLKLAERMRVDLPVTSQVARLLEGEITPDEMANALLMRPIKMEF